MPLGKLILLVGPPGSGKSTFCQRTTLQGLAMDKPIIYVTTKYGSSDAERVLKEMGLREAEPSLLNYVDAYNETVGVSAPDRPDTVYADCNDLSSIDIAITRLQELMGKKNVLLIFDSLTSPYLFSGTEILRFITQTLSRFTATGNSVLTCIDEGCGKSEDLVSMMSLADIVIKMEVEEDKQLYNVLKHPEMRATVIEIPTEPRRIRQKLEWTGNPRILKQLVQAFLKGDKAAMRTEMGDYVNLFWPNFAHWSCMLWDPRRFPTMIYDFNKEESSSIRETLPYAPWTIKLQLRFMPKNFSKKKDMKRLINMLPFPKIERSGILEYLEDVSKMDEHYVRIHESSDCWGFEKVGAPMASHLPANIAGSCKGFESLKGLEREWDAIETKCIGLGDPYCEVKIIPGEIEGLKASLEKDSPVIERIHERLMGRLMGFLLEGKPLIERPSLGGDVHVHVVMHAMGFPHIAGERYRMAQRMGGAKAGKEIGELLIDRGIGEDESVRRVINFLEHCKVGRIGLGETLRMRENCESFRTLLFTSKRDEPCCFFTTGFLNGFFSAVKNQHVKETRCIVMGDPYCEWEFR